jgi:hypothetical protein
MSPGDINVILRRLDDLHEDVREVKQQAKETNGRVKSLELWKARTDGARAAMDWLKPLLVAVVSGGAVAVLTVVLT